MNRFVLVITSLALVACVSNSKNRVEPARSTTPGAVESASVDMTALMGKEVDGQTFLQQCVTQTGRSFTYDVATAKMLERTYIRWSNQVRMTPTEFENLVGQLLYASGFEMNPVGPAELRVFAVKLRAR